VWSVRLDSLSDIRRLSVSDRAPDVAHNMDKIMPAVIDRLNDTHYKVVQAALEILEILYATFPSHAEAFLEKTLVRLFAKLGDAKEAVRQQASHTVDSLRDLYRVCAHFPLCYHLLLNM